MITVERMTAVGEMAAQVLTLALICLAIWQVTSLFQGPAFSYIKWETYCCLLNVCVPPNSYGEALILNVMVFGDGDFGR